MQLNTTQVSIQKDSVSLSITQNTGSITDKSPKPLIASTLSPLESIDSLLLMIESVNKQLKEQESQLIDIRTELNKIDTDLSHYPAHRESLGLISRSKMVRKTQSRKSGFDVFLGSGSELSDGELEVEVRISGIPKFFVKNRKYKRLVSKKMVVR